MDGPGGFSIGITDGMYRRTPKTRSNTGYAIAWPPLLTSVSPSKGFGPCASTTLRNQCMPTSQMLTFPWWAPWEHIRCMGPSTTNGRRPSAPSTRGALSLNVRGEIPRRGDAARRRPARSQSLSTLLGRHPKRRRGNLPCRPGLSPRACHHSCDQSPTCQGGRSTTQFAGRCTPFEFGGYGSAVS